MSDHGGSKFNNLCLKVPRNPRSDQPSPIYEQKYLNELENKARKLSIDSDIMMRSKKSLEESDKETLKSFLEFFDSIPEYDDINHLSNKDFYRKLENLKEKQRAYNEYIQNKLRIEVRDTEWVEDYKKLNFETKKNNRSKKRKSLTKSFCSTPTLNKSPNLNLNKNLDDVESLSSLEKDAVIKPPSRRSVRIETPSEKISSYVDDSPEPFSRPKSRANISSAASSKKVNHEWDELSILDIKEVTERESPLQTKSAPASPGRNKQTAVEWKEDGGITIPKPFQMTVRDEENKIIDEIIIHEKKPEEKSEMFKAHPVPIESQIPLFDKLMADQERKNFLVRERRKAALQAKMKPFSFTRRDEEIQELTKRLSKSSPCIFLDDTPLKMKKFRAKPVPKSIFSNYIYKKMYEDEFYRALQKRIRAEEMLKAASLPPSMAKREKNKPEYDVCPRSYKDFCSSEKTIRKSNKRISPLKMMLEKYAEELEDLTNDYMSNSSTPDRSKALKKYDSKKTKKSMRYSSASSKSSDERPPSSLPLQSVSRSNLAAILRIESARKRQEMDMVKKLEEAKLKEEARWKEKVMRMKPVWQTLAYSHEEDLAMRLKLRKDEERLRNEEHRLRMQLMLGRVNQQPTLFERQSQMKYPKTREELIESLHKHCGGSNRKNPKRSVSDLSERRIEMKDEAIQAFLDEYFKDKSESEDTKETCTDEKDQCDSLDSVETVKEEC